MKYSFLLYLIICRACFNHALTPPIFEVSYPHNKHGEIKISSSTKHTIIDITSESGMGKGTVKLIKGKWPEILSVRLHLKGLEGFTVSNGKTTIDKSDMSVKAYDKNGQLFEKKYLMNEPGYYEVHLPNALFEAGTTYIEIHWVDFYR